MARQAIRRLLRHGPVHLFCLYGLLIAGVPPVGTTAPAPRVRPAALLPDPSPVAEWPLVRPSITYEGDRIFEYMDGAGEIPRSYGFQELATALYGRDDNRVEVAVFAMGDPAAAYGYFSVRDRVPGERVVGAGRNVRVVPGFVVIGWRGCHTVVARTDTGRAEDAVLERLARAVLARVPGVTQPPDLVRRLPVAGRVTDPPKYVRGKPAFDAEVLFLPQDVFALRSHGPEVAAADYAGAAMKCRLALLRYRDAADAARAFRAYASLSGAMRRGCALADWLARDAAGRWNGAFRAARELGLVLGAPDAAAARRALATLRKAAFGSTGVPAAPQRK